MTAGPGWPAVFEIDLRRHLHGGSARLAGRQVPVDLENSLTPGEFKVELERQTRGIYSELRDLFTRRAIDAIHVDSLERGPLVGT